MLQADLGSEFLAVDWGNTNRRAYRVGTNGIAIDSLSDGKGVLMLARDRIDYAVAEIRQRLGDLPMLLAGPIGSNKGWHNAPYVACPADADEIAAKIYWVDERTGIVPGISQLNPPDVLRGEEVQALGGLGLGLNADGLICSPGTHSKWLRLAGGRLVSFTSAMTGELFSLLRQHSILAELLTDEVRDGAAFRSGVADGLEGKPLMQALFSMRAAHVLGHGTGDEASYASGLLIGTDWRDNAGDASDGVISLIGAPDLCALYAQAASLAGHRTNSIDGAEAFVAGMMVLKEHLP